MNRSFFVCIGSFGVGNALSRSFVAAHTTAGIAQEAIMHTASAVSFLLGDQKPFIGLNSHKSGPLYHVIMDTKPVQQNGQEYRVSDQNKVTAGKLFNEPVCPFLRSSI